MALPDELRGYAKALGSDAALTTDYPLAACAETMLRAANELENLQKRVDRWEPSIASRASMLDRSR